MGQVHAYRRALRREAQTYKSLLVSIWKGRRPEGVFLDPLSFTSPLLIGRGSLIYGFCSMKENPIRSVLPQLASSI